MMNFKTEALKNLLPGVTHAYNITEDVVQIFDTNVPSPTDSEITAEVTRLQAEYDANAYARSRKTAYDALNQLELISDDAINGTTTHADAITAIKLEFPKP